MSEEKRKHVCVIVQGGCVQSVYSDSKNISVEVYDLDDHDEQIDILAREVEADPDYDMVW